MSAYYWKSPEAFWLLASGSSGRRLVVVDCHPAGGGVPLPGGPGCSPRLRGLRSLARRGLPLLRMAALGLAVVALARPQTMGARVRISRWRGSTS